jgi:hypothetical protein
MGLDLAVWMTATGTEPTFLVMHLLAIAHVAERPLVAQSGPNSAGRKTVLMTL